MQSPRKYDRLQYSVSPNTCSQHAHCLLRILFTCDHFLLKENKDYLHNVMNFAKKCGELLLRKISMKSGRYVVICCGNEIIFIHTPHVSGRAYGNLKLIKILAVRSLHVPISQLALTKLLDDRTLSCLLSHALE